MSTLSENAKKKKNSEKKTLENTTLFENFF